MHQLQRFELQLEPLQKRVHLLTVSRGGSLTQSHRPGSSRPNQRLKRPFYLLNLLPAHLYNIFRDVLHLFVDCEICVRSMGKVIEPVPEPRENECHSSVIDTAVLVLIGSTTTRCPCTARSLSWTTRGAFLPCSSTGLSSKLPTLGRLIMRP